MQTDRPTDAPKKNKGKLKQLHIVSLGAKQNTKLSYYFGTKGALYYSYVEVTTKAGDPKAQYPFFILELTYVRVIPT